MGIENSRWLAAVVAAHPDRQVVGRTRLQKTIWLLQRLGLPTDYTYSLHFYGPYSDEVKSDIWLAEQFGLVNESPRTAQDGSEYYIISANAGGSLPDIGEFTKPLRQLTSDQDPVVLELAATYDAFRKMGLDHDSAMASLRAKKGDKCERGRGDRALALLQGLGLLNDSPDAAVV